MLRNIKTYTCRIERTNDITHNFFVDDLKLYASNINIKIPEDLKMNRLKMVTHTNLPRLQEGQRLKMVPRMFESRVITVAQYLTINRNYSNTIKFVYDQEQQNVLRIQQKLLECYNVKHYETSTLKYLSEQFMKADLIAQKEKYTAKVMHGYYERKIDNNTQIDKHLSNCWKKDKFITPQLENYLSLI